MSEIRTIELPAEIWFTIATYTLPEAFSGLCVTSVFINKTIKAWRSSFFFKQDVRDYTMAPTLTLNLLIPVYGEISRTINLVTFGGQESDKIGIYFGDDFLDNKGKWCLLKGANLARCTFKYFQFWSCYVILIDRVVTYVIDSSLSIHSRHNVPSCLYHVCDAMNPFDSSVQLIYDQVGFDKDCCAVSLLLQEDWDVVLAIMKVTAI